MKKVIKTIILSLFVMILISCLNDDDIPKQVNETEVITDVTLIFTKGSGEDKMYTYTDPKYRSKDYKDPVITLKKEDTYKVSTHFIDRSNPDDIEDVTEEVMEEKDDHFVEYKFNTIAIDLVRKDEEKSTDNKGIQIGLFTQWTPTKVENGSVQVVLIHQPESKDISNPNGNHTGGETDVEVIFDVEIEK